MTTTRTQEAPTSALDAVLIGLQARGYRHEYVVESLALGDRWNGLDFGDGTAEGPFLRVMDEGESLTIYISDPNRPVIPNRGYAQLTGDMREHAAALVASALTAAARSPR